MIGHFFDLIRIRISLMVGLSSFAGACLYTHHFNSKHFYGVMAAIFLSFGCSALNQLQERDSDAVMERTVKRPLPDGQMLPGEVFNLSIIMIGLSWCFIFLAGSLQAFFLNIITIIGYNFVYTPIKKKTPFALMAGSVIGALPPAIGYTCVGGNMTDISILMVTAVLYLWQTPHFAILAEKYADEYARAGFMTISGIYGQQKSRIFVNVWTMAYICALLYIPAAGFYKTSTVPMLHIAMTVFFGLSMLLSFRYHKMRFHYINLSAVMFFILILTDSVISK